ncbi:MAG TPA: hypothetical protein VFB27_14840, partial [Opitutaceae bacterium]|nr:hypothetical protein [Opitutaceae bacterium]
TLGVGEFFACWGTNVHKVYVQPAWLEAETAQRVAMGILVRPEAPQGKEEDDMDDWKRKYEAERERADKLDRQVANQANEIRMLQGSVQRLQQLQGKGEVEEFVDRGQKAQAAAEAAGARREYTLPESFDAERLYQAFKLRLIEEGKKDPGILRILTQRPELEVKVTRPVMEVDGATLRGRIARLIVEGFLNEAKTAYAVFQELQRLGAKVAKPSVYGEMEKLAVAGFVTKEADGFKKAPDAIVRAARA